MAATLTSPFGSKEFKALTGLRGLAALWVVALHYSPDFTLCFPGYRELAPLFGKGHLGVDIFFVLSGFILSHVYRPCENRPDKKGLPRFILFRLARIYPAHLATLLILMLMVGTAQFLGIRMEGQYDSKALLPNMTMTHAWPGIERITAGSVWNYPSWSVSAEWFAYLFIFPLSHYSLRLAERLKISHGLFCYIYLGALWLAYARHWIQWPTAGVMVSLEFLAGCHLYYFSLANKNQLISLSRNAFPVLVCLLLAGTFLLSDGISRTTLYFSVPLILLGLSCEKNIVARLLSTPPMRWLGIISYSIYLMHAIVQKVIVYLERSLAIGHASLLTRSMFAGLIVAALLTCSAALYYGVEDPARRWIKKRLF